MSNIPVGMQVDDLAKSKLPLAAGFLIATVFSLLLWLAIALIVFS